MFSLYFKYWNIVKKHFKELNMVSSYTFFFEVAASLFLLEFLMWSKDLIGEKTLNNSFGGLRTLQLVETQVTFEPLEELKCSLCYITLIMKAHEFLNVCFDTA